jgi:hypothetical protein
MKAVFAVVLIAFLVGLGASGGAQAWSTGVTVSPASAVRGSTVTYRVTIENTDPDTIGIYDVTVRFGWQDPSGGTNFFTAATPVSIAVGNTREFSASIPIPANATADADHVVQVRVDATVPGLLGGWSVVGRHSHTYDATLRVTKPLIPGAEAFLLVLAAAALALTRRR